jgi:hypothetical protein
MSKKLILIGLGVVLASLAVPKQAAAGAFEFSFGFSFNRSYYSETSYNWTRRWGTSIGYHFNDFSEVELAFQDVTDRTSIVGYEDTTFHDRIYSANWVQAFTGKNFPVQPYIKVGIGQLDREATGSYANGASPPSLVLSITGVVGTGLRIYITKTFAIRTELQSYLTGGSIRTWQDNVGYNIGTSFYF